MSSSSETTSGFARNTIMFSLLTVASRLTGVLRTMTFGAVLGAGHLSDAYFLADSLPFLLFEVVIGGLLTAVFLPLLVKEQETHGKSSSQAWRAANLLLGSIGVLLCIMSVLVVIFSPALIDMQTMFAHKEGLDEYRSLSVNYLRWLAPEILLFGISSIFMAILNSHGKFAITAAAPIFNNLFMIGTLLAYSFGLYSAKYIAVGSTLGVAVQALVMIPSLLKIKMPIRPIIDFRDPLFQFVKSVAPAIMMLSLANLIATVVRVNLLSPIEGGVTAYKFCFQLIMMPYGIIAVSIITVLVPTLSRQSANNDYRAFGMTLSMGFRITFCIMMPIMILTYMLPYPIIQLLFERGKFTPAETAFTAAFLRMYSLTILPYALLMLLTKSFFAARNTSIPTSLNICGAGINIGLGILLVSFMGAPGVALSSGITYATTTVLGLYLLRKFVISFDWKQLIQTMAKSICAALIMSLVIFTTISFFPQANDIAIIHTGISSDIRMPAFDRSGNIVELESQSDMDRFYPLIASEDFATTPTLDADSKYVIAFAPPTHTTTTIALVPPKDKSIFKSFGNEQSVVENLNLRLSESKTTSGLLRRTWCMIRIANNVQCNNIIFVPHGKSIDTGLVHGINFYAFVRILIATVLGLLTYIIAGYAFRMHEVDYLLRKFKRS